MFGERYWDVYDRGNDKNWIIKICKLLLKVVNICYGISIIWIDFYEWLFYVNN